MPTVPSYYCRNIETYKDKKFLFPGGTIASLHKQYVETAKTGLFRIVCLTLFKKRSMNLTFLYLYQGKTNVIYGC